MRRVLRELDAAGIDDVVKRRPPGAGVVLGARAEQVPAARHALVRAPIAQLVVLVRERPVCFSKVGDNKTISTSSLSTTSPFRVLE